MRLQRPHVPFRWLHAAWHLWLGGSANGGRFSGRGDGAHDRRLDYHIRRAANHQEVFYIVAADQE
jgi:hypothetical protein